MLTIVQRLFVYFRFENGDKPIHVNGQLQPPILSGFSSEMLQLFCLAIIDPQDHCNCGARRVPRSYLITLRSGVSEAVFTKASLILIPHCFTTLQKHHTIALLPPHLKTCHPQPPLPPSQSLQSTSPPTSQTPIPHQHSTSSPPCAQHAHTRGSSN